MKQTFLCGTTHVCSTLRCRYYITLVLLQTKFHLYRIQFRTFSKSSYIKLFHIFKACFNLHVPCWICTCPTVKLLARKEQCNQKYIRRYSVTTAVKDMRNKRFIPSARFHDTRRALRCALQAVCVRNVNRQLAKYCHLVEHIIMTHSIEISLFLLHKRA